MLKEKPNFDFLMQIAAGDFEFKKQIVQILKTEFPLEKSIFYNCFFANNLEEAAEMVNKINQKIGVLGMYNSQILTIQFEKNLKDKKKELFEHFDEILKDITTFIELL